MTGRDFLRCLIAALCFLALSAVLLTIAFVFHHWPDVEFQSGVKLLEMEGQELRLAIGKGHVMDDSLILEEPKDGNAVLVAPRSFFRADDYQVLEFWIEDRNPSLQIAFYWVRKDDPRKPHFAMLPWNGDLPMAYRLESNEEWSGDIIEFGLSIRGDLRGKPLVIRELSLAPMDVENLLFAVWSEWLTFEGWKQYSINAILGAPKSALASPVVAAAAWTGLAMLMFLLWRLLQAVHHHVAGSGSKEGALQELSVVADSASAQDAGSGLSPSLSKTLITLGAMFLIPWLALDAKWQINLLRQHKETWYQFAGKSHHEQHLAAEDATFYHFAKLLRQEIPQNNSGRLFILQDKWQGYERLKMMYYLLPLSVYAYGNQPDSRLLQEGDLLLAINPSVKLRYDAKSGLLHWGKRAVQVELLHRHEVGQLYLIKKNHFLLRQYQLSHQWHTLSASGRVMPDPVALTSIPSYFGPDPGVVAVSKDEKGRLRARFQEWDYRDDRHATETVSVLLSLLGRHRMKDGSSWEVGLVGAQRAGEWQTARFKRSFDRPPRLFLMPQQSISSLALVARAESVDGRGFRFRLDSQESKSPRDIDVSIAYLAISSPSGEGQVKIDGRKVFYQVTTLEVGSGWTSIGGFEVRLQEEQSHDEETNHAAEKVDLLILDDALFGQVVSNREVDTVSLRMRRRRR